jgi:RNA polymerase primary sigma factor
MVRLPQNKLQTIRKILKVHSRLEQKNQRPPSPFEIAEELDMNVDKVKKTLKSSGKHISLDAPLKEGESSNLYSVTPSKNTLKPDRKVMQESLNTDISTVLDTLPEKESAVVRMYYGIGKQNAMSLHEIGEFFDLTRERVRQIKEKGIRRLRNKSQAESLRAYL